MNAIDWINQKYHTKRYFPAFKSGDTISVHVKIKEGEKERIQQFKGMVIAIHRNGPGSSFTVRKISSGVGVERIFSFSSPAVDKIDLVSVGEVRRAKLYYLRDLSGKKARVTSSVFAAQSIMEKNDALIALENPQAIQAPVKKEKRVAPNKAAAKPKKK